MTFQAPAIIKVGAPTADGGLRISFVTNEITDEEKLKVMKFNGSFGYVLFRANAFDDTEAPTEDAKDDSKSQAQRIRASLFVLWKAKGSNGDFQTFYKQKTEQFIDKIKENID